MSYQAFKFFGRNTKGRDFVVGDIHGHFMALEKLLWQVGFEPLKDRVFAVGDLIDRGPESDRTIEFLNYRWFNAIRGNHEQMLLDSENDVQLYHNWVTFNGGNWWLNIPHRLHQRIRAVFDKLPIAMEIDTARGRVGLVHADIPIGVSWQAFVRQLDSDQEVIDQALWSRSRFKQLQLMGRTQPVQGIDIIIFGHTPVSKPVSESNVIYIDTGAAYPQDRTLGTLSMLEVQPTIKLHQIKTDPAKEPLLRKQNNRYNRSVQTETVPA